MVDKRFEKYFKYIEAKISEDQFIKAEDKIKNKIESGNYTMDDIDEFSDVLLSFILSPKYLKYSYEYMINCICRVVDDKYSDIYGEKII